LWSRREINTDIVTICVIDDRAASDLWCVGPREDGDEAALHQKPQSRKQQNPKAKDVRRQFLARRVTLLLHCGPSHSELKRVKFMPIKAIEGGERTVATSGSSGKPSRSSIVPV
jgi:hypothetical protein